MNEPHLVADGGRPMTDPTPDAVLEAMNPGEPYTLSELDGVFDASRETIRNRLEALVDDGRLLKKEHTSRVITYRIPA